MTTVSKEMLVELIGKLDDLKRLTVAASEAQRAVDEARAEAIAYGKIVVDTLPQNFKPVVFGGFSFKANGSGNVTVEEVIHLA